MGQLPAIQKVNEPATIDCISGQAIRMPGNNTLGFTGFNSIQHLVKQRPTRLFGAAGLLVTIDDSQRLVIADQPLDFLGL